ncbi:hypothetical protein PV326_011920 [Microctonus aethiopoides]|nr:hypothetical protein PV326_011920 [Microctonus aethiopoides]
MTFFRKYLRRPSLLLQQLYYCIEERKNEKKQQKESKIKALHKHTNGPLLPIHNQVNIEQYKGIEFEYFRLMVSNSRDNCVKLQSGIIGEVVNIIKITSSNEYNLIICKYDLVEDFYNIFGDISSTFFGVHLCSGISDDLLSVPLHNIHAKCYKMPY